jgi:uncharacterized membrane protein YeiH
METLLLVVEVLGILAFAFSGILEARKKSMDFVGVYAVAMITAFGGGSLRDMLLDHHPLFWIANPAWPLILFLFALASAPFSQSLYLRPWVANLVSRLDALGLGLFAASGTLIAQQAGCVFFISMLFGVMTGVFGGVLRDTLCNEVPGVFRRSELYATCAFLGSAVFLLTVALGASTLIATLLCIAVTFGSRMTAVRYKLTLPI